MKRFFQLSAPLIFLFSLTLVPVTAIASTGPDFVTLAKDLKPTVVNISTSKTVQSRRSPFPGLPSPRDDFFDDFFKKFFQDQQPNGERKERSLGSGFIISNDGFILTNDHVINSADEIKVKLADGRTFPATIKGQDSKLDIALLQIDTGEKLPVARLGDSDTLAVGEWVMAIGNPFGLEQTVTVGIVSAKGRVINAGPYDNFIQTDASINPGNSGGPLFNLRGEVIGINTAIVAGGQGIGFATPINAAKDILPQLRESGHVTRGWLGVGIQPLTNELAQSFGLDEPNGVLISDVTTDSPAAKAGLKRGDIILEFEDQPIHALNDLPRLVAATPVGKEVTLKIWRDNKAQTVKVEIGQLSDGQTSAPSATPTGEILGLGVSDVTPEAQERFGLASKEGALIARIDPEGMAMEANLRVGDVVVEVNGVTVKNAEDFRTAIDKVKKGEAFRLLIQRGDGLFYTVVKPQ